MRYRLRLGDGTVLAVDRDGLRTWLADTSAAVQLPGKQEWRPLRAFLAEEAAAERLKGALVPPEPRRAPAPPPREVPPPIRPVEIPVGEPPIVQAFADDPKSSRAAVPPWLESPEPPAEAPAIRLKPLDEEPAAPYADSHIEVVEEGGEEAPAEEDHGGDYVEAEGRHDRLEGQLLHVVSTLGTFLSRCLDPLTPLARGWPSRPGDEPAPRRGASRPPAPLREPPPPMAPPPRVEPPAPVEPPPDVAPLPQVRVLAEDPGFTAGESPAGLDELPVIPLKPLDNAQQRVTAAFRGLSETLTGWVAGLTGWADRLQQRLKSRRATPLRPPTEPTPREARVPTPAPRAPLAPPPPISELPSLRLADAHEEPELEDVYEGGIAESVFPTLWLWAKRIVLAGGLVTVGVIAGRSWETWFPRAGELGQSLFAEIDRQAHSGERAREQERALSDATERLPHLAPATIRLVLSTSSSGVLEPPEVFQLATEAADRGQRALTAAEAAELRALQQELLSNLRPPQRRRLEEYDRARTTRGVFPFENPYALDLVARGARAMPARSRERLQALVGKAVAAGLRSPAGTRSR